MKIKLKFGLLLPLFLICIIFSERRIYTFIALFAAALHELGHILAAKICKIELTSLSLDLFGARIDTGMRLCSYRDEIILCLSGPLVNILFSVVAFSISHYVFENEYIVFFAAASLALGALNLLPIKSFDGGRILTCLLDRILNIYTSERILTLLSFMCCFSLWCFSVYLMITVGSSLSLFVFSVSLFSKIFIAQ